MRFAGKIILAFIALAAAAFAPASSAQSQLAGDWQGVVNVQGTQYRIVLHLAADKDGGLSALIDNLDEGAMGVVGSPVTLKDSKLTIVIDAFQGYYEGKVNADATEIAGAWNQGASYELVFHRAPAPAKPAAVPSIAGDWQGALEIGVAKLHLILHISANKGGALTATLDSVDQGALGIPVSTVTLKDAKLALTVDAVHGSYEATVNKDLSEMDGTWDQGQPMALNFTRAPAGAAAAKPTGKPTSRPAPPSEIDGSWQGLLDAGSRKLRIVFKIVNTGDGLTAQLQSPDQSPAWVNATSIDHKGSDLTIRFAGLGIVYEGKLASDLSSMDGTFTQMGNAMPLAVKRDKSQ
jgi:hypothetical protein